MTSFSRFQLASWSQLVFRSVLVWCLCTNPLPSARAEDPGFDKESRLFSRKTMDDLREIANSGTLGGEKLRFLVPLDSLRRKDDFTQPNEAFFQTLDFIDYARTRAMSDVLRDAKNLLFGKNGVAVDSWTRGELEVLKFDLSEQRVRLYGRDEKIDPSRVTAEVLLVSLNRVKYLLVVLPVNYFQRGLHYVRMVAQAGVIIVVGSTLGGAAHIATLIGYAVKTMASLISIGAWSLFYLAHKKAVVPMYPIDTLSGNPSDSVATFDSSNGLGLAGRCSQVFRLN